MNLTGLIDDLAIRRTLAEYCHLCDAGEFEALLERFSPDGEIVYGARVARGRKELQAFFQEFQGQPERMGKHLTTNIVIDVADDRATAFSDFLFLRFQDGELAPAITGSYRDRLARVEDRWRIERREIIALAPPKR